MILLPLATNVDEAPRHAPNSLALEEFLLHGKTHVVRLALGNERDRFEVRIRTDQISLIKCDPLLQGAHGELSNAAEGDWPAEIKMDLFQHQGALSTSEGILSYRATIERRDNGFVFIFHEAHFDEDSEAWTQRTVAEWRKDQALTVVELASLEEQDLSALPRELRVFVDYVRSRVVDWILGIKFSVPPEQRTTGDRRDETCWERLRALELTDSLPDTDETDLENTDIDIDMMAVWAAVFFGDSRVSLRGFLTEELDARYVNPEPVTVLGLYSTASGDSHVYVAIPSTVIEVAREFVDEINDEPAEASAFLRRFEAWGPYVGDDEEDVEN